MKTTFLALSARPRRHNYHTQRFTTALQPIIALFDFVCREKAWQSPIQSFRAFSTSSTAWSTLDGANTTPRQLRSELFIPQASLPASDSPATPINTNDLLVKAGYLRQAHSGIFHLLPLGLRVQLKISQLIQRHMRALSASEVSLSSISTQSLWTKSGRYRKDGEFFTLKDRKGTDLILSPTHEEEITMLVKETIQSPKELPARLFQIGRKYRDEKRPRGGLLRGREFVMKDLYTFDKSEADAHMTYDAVRQAYVNIFNELKIPYVEARADSGNMGGNLSHEFHFPSSLGEDDIITCSNCSYAKNEEFVPDFKKSIRKFEPRPNPSSASLPDTMATQTFISKDRTTLFKVFVSTEGQINPFAVKEALKDHAEVDTGVEDAEALFTEKKSKQAKMYYLFDSSFSDEQMMGIGYRDFKFHQRHKLSTFTVKLHDDGQNHLLKKRTGDQCPECSGTLTVQKAIEIGHTFHLGSRYSNRFDFHVPGTKDFVSMGCHGIGVSRLISAAASALSDDVGLMWPRVIAPFEVCVVVNQETTTVGEELNDQLPDLDVLIDDRDSVGFGWKLKDADLIGYPVIVVVGKGWAREVVEIQCRRLGVKEEVVKAEVAPRVRELLQRL